MRFGYSRAKEGMRQIVRQKASLYDLTRRTSDGKGRFGEHDGTTTTVNDVSLHLFRPNENNVDTEYGDRLEGDLHGLALPNADLQVDDRLTHGSDKYEVEDIVNIPSENEQVLKLFSLTRRTNDDSTN